MLLTTKYISTQGALAAIKSQRAYRSNEFKDTYIKLGRSKAVSALTRDPLKWFSLDREYQTDSPDHNVDRSRLGVNNRETFV